MLIKKAAIRSWGLGDERGREELTTVGVVLGDSADEGGSEEPPEGGRTLAWTIVRGGLGETGGEGRTAGG